MRNNIAVLRLVLVSVLCILVELNGIAADLYLPPTDSICEGNAYITTQAEWDLFAVDYAGCTTFIGDITIDNSSAAIDSVYGLDSLRVMVGDLVVEYTGVPFVFNTLNSLDSLAGDLSISNCPENFTKLSELDFAENIFLQNTQLDETNGLVNLRECQSIIMIADHLNQYNIFNRLNRCPLIEIRTESNSGTSGSLENSFVQLMSVDTVIVDYHFISIWQSFLAVQNIDFLQLGSLIDQIVTVSGSFDALTSANTVFIHTNYININLPNLAFVENIHIEEYPPSIIINEPILESLETISGTAYLWICRDIVELSELRFAGELNIFSQSTPIENIGPSAIILPRLEFVQGNLEIRASPYGQFIDTSLHSLYAPLLTNVGGSISIRDAPALTSCISPAFCESANYSPNWGEVSGGPGCSTVEEIQAQCDTMFNASCEGNYYLTTQDEYDQFAADHAGCTTFTGDITIDNSSAAIDSVYGMDSLRVMVGDLSVDGGEMALDLFALNNLDSLVGNMSLINTFPTNGLNGLKYAANISLNFIHEWPLTNLNFNLNQSGAFQQLKSCETLTLRGISSFVDNFNLLESASKIEIENYWNATFINNSFNTLETIDTVIINGLYQVSNTFQNVTSSNLVDLGTDSNFSGMLALINQTFQQLETVGSLRISSEELALTFPSLQSAQFILLSGSGYGYSNDTAMAQSTLFNSLQIVSNDFTIALPKQHFTFPNLTLVGGNMYILNNYPEVVTFIEFSAPNLNYIGGNITLLGGNNLTTCESPAFCESANYSPNFIEVSGGPGCSSVAEIQAQCDAIFNTSCEGNYYLTTQDEYDQFAADHAGCTTFIGDITIDNSLAALDSVYGLDSLHTMVGNLAVDFAGNVLAFEGLYGLDSLAGDLTLRNYPDASGLGFLGFDSLQYARNITLDDIKLYTNSDFGNFLSLERAENITFIQSEVMYTSAIFNNLQSAHKIEFFHNNPQTSSSLFDSFNSLVEADSIISYGTGYFQNCFNHLQSAETVSFGENGVTQSMLGCLDSLAVVGKLFLNAGNLDISLSNLQTANEILFAESSSSNTELFPNLTSVQGTAFILTSRTNNNFDALQSVEGGLGIFNFSPETSLVSLANIGAVGDMFSILGADSIYAPNLTFIGGQLQIEEFLGENLNFMNSNLQIGSFTIYNSPNLSSCNANAICNSLDLDPTLSSVGNNAPGCSSIEEIQAQCLGSYASGLVYYDIDCDNEFNNDDALVSYPVLLQGDTVPIGSSGQAGYFFVPLELNTSTSLFVQHSSDWTSSGPITIATADTLAVFTDLQIGLCPVTIIHDVAVHLNASMDPRPGFTVRYSVVAQNLWPGSDSASVVFSTAQMPGAVITGYAAGGTLAGNQVSFTTDLLYGQSQTLWVDVLVPVGTTLGAAYTATATIALNDAQAIDSHPENNNYTLAQTVIGSYDPNDKLVTPAIIDLLDIDSTQTATIEYTIRFQNTGTAEAFFVRVLDTLSQALNPATFELIATSHPSEITFHDNHTIEWFFDNIMLPDSFSNEPESHGFIQFRIQTLPLGEPFTLENEAAIYFDFNEPVITPPAVTAVVICAEAGDACDDGDACTTNDLIQSDCSCAGTVADTDNDGICDASELAGCTDIEACNYNTLATDDDGSCTYVESLSIEGETNPVASIEVSYTYPGPLTSNYQWSINPGSIVSGQGTSTVSVIWTDDLLGTLQVTETNETDCVGDTVVLEVSIFPISITSLFPQSIILYPNPANDVLHIAGDIPSNAQVSIFNGIGQCVYTGSFSSTIDVRSFAGGVYHLHVGHNGTYENAKFTIARD